MMMVEKKFYIESKKPLQEIGMRAQVVSFLMAHAIKDGNVVNDADPHKVIIAIRTDTEQRIIEIKAELVDYLNRLNKNDFCYRHFPSDIWASELMELNNPGYMAILPLNELSSSLMLEQTSKGVGAMRYIAETLKPLEELPSILKELSKKLK